jgi:hypothetical protein
MHSERSKISPATSKTWKSPASNISGGLESWEYLLETFVRGFQTGDITSCAHARRPMPARLSCGGTSAAQRRLLQPGDGYGYAQRAGFPVGRRRQPALSIQGLRCTIHEIRLPTCWTRRRPGWRGRKLRAWCRRSTST